MIGNNNTVGIACQGDNTDSMLDFFDTISINRCMDLKEFGKLLRAARKKAGFTQEQVAERLGMT